MFWTHFPITISHPVRAFVIKAVYTYTPGPNMAAQEHRRGLYKPHVRSLANEHISPHRLSVQRIRVTGRGCGDHPQFTLSSRYSCWLSLYLPLCPALSITKATGILDDTSTSSDGDGERLEKVLPTMCPQTMCKALHTYLAAPDHTRPASAV
jgi:hypothetical protein